MNFTKIEQIERKLVSRTHPYIQLFRNHSLCQLLCTQCVGNFKFASILAIMERQ